MKKLATAILLVSMFSLSGCIIVSDDGSSTFTIDNQSDFTLYEVNLSPVGSSSWGPNLIRNPLFPGDAVVIDFIDCDTYDARVIDETGVECVLGNLDLCATDDVWVVDNIFLDTCAFNP